MSEPIALSKMERFKLAAISTEEIQDAEFEKYFFLNLAIDSEDELVDAIAILERHRPAVAKRYFQNIVRPRS